MPDDCLFNDTVCLDIVDSKIFLDSIESQMESLSVSLDETVSDLNSIKGVVSSLFNSGVSDIRSSIVFSSYVKFKSLLIFLKFFLFFSLMSLIFQVWIFLFAVVPLLV